MSDTEMKLSELCKQVSLYADGMFLTEKDDGSGKPWKSNQYRITLSYKGQKYSLDYWMGIGCKKGPDSAGVMSCLLLDASALDMSFDSWCMEYGYDIDSRKAEKIYFECCESGARLQKFLGSDYRMFQSAENDV